MKVLCIVLVILVLLQAMGGSPAHSRKSPAWKHLRSPVSYRERLQSWGLYPKVFRYGTANHHREALAKKKKELLWVKRLVREYESQDDDFRMKASNAIDETNQYRQQYEKFKEKLFQKMEQDAMEILWQNR
ncbi:hypothetical protein ZHAS_00018033 [Anopheles sinensis]|uniref:Uncharacterized protein n=1 Tax=Anopheles sinensis TaxID=74873 RepID=A0A084WIE9_ANOSI|nr:hypothetical protein ZHAS_00018033 [Anopheles sinensis]